MISTRQHTNSHVPRLTHTLDMTEQTTATPATEPTIVAPQTVVRPNPNIPEGVTPISVGGDGTLLDVRPTTPANILYICKVKFSCPREEWPLILNEVMELVYHSEEEQEQAQTALEVVTRGYMEGRLEAAHVAAAAVKALQTRDIYSQYEDLPGKLTEDDLRAFDESCLAGSTPQAAARLIANKYVKPTTPRNVFFP